MNLQRTSYAGFVALLLGLTLSGCITSKSAKFPASTAVALFGDGGQYKVFDRVEGNQYMENDAAEIKKRPDGGYDFSQQGNEPTAVDLLPLNAPIFG